MTNKEAIEWLQSMCCGDCTGDWDNCPEYDANICNPRKVVNMAIEALEKQEPKFVKCPKGWRGTRYTRYYCPNCNRTLRMDEKWCNDCGQHIKQPKRKLVDNHYELDWSNKE